MATVLEPNVKDGKASLGEFTGTTGNAYADVVDLDCRKVDEVTILLCNTHVTAGLAYKVLVENKYGGHETEDVAETVLAAGQDVLWTSSPATYEAIRPQVKSNVADTAATYSTQVTGKRRI